MKAVHGFWGWFLAGWLAGLSPVGGVGGEPVELSAAEGTAGQDPQPIDSKGRRLREGSKLIDQVGEFQKTGDEVSFYLSEGGVVLRALENLALERVLRAADDNSGRRVWRVSGTITEYRGENYLLISKAVLKVEPRATPAAGAQVRERTEGN